MPFVKGDPRINRKGRPADFDMLRSLARSIANEPAIKKDGEPLVIGGHKITVIEAILRGWAQSNKAHLQEMFVQYCYGKVPQPVDIAGDQTVRFVFDDAIPGETAPDPDA
jgi:hypothetical protein